MIKKYTVLIFTLLLGFLSLTNVYAQPKLAQSPLFSSNAVPPNIFFEIDDSGSMSWNLLSSSHFKYCDYNSNSSSFGGDYDCVLYVNGEPLVEVDKGYMIMHYYIYRDFDQALLGRTCRYHSVCKNPNAFDWRFWSSDLNQTYYNPSNTYQVWDGSGLPNASFSAARHDPQPGKNGYTSTLNMDTFVYAVWKDTHGFSGNRPRRGSNINRTLGANNRIDLWDEFDLHVVRNNSVLIYNMGYRVTSSGALQLQILLPSNTWRNINSSEYIDIIRGQQSLINASTVLSGSGSHTALNGRTVNEEKQNVANWYSFHRDRALVTKSAISSVVVKNPAFRYGLSVINYPNQLLVEHPDGLSGFDSHNSDMLEDLRDYEFPNSGTPLRRGLQFAGDYYKGDYTVNEPIDYSCQQNFTILMTDGYWNGSSPGGISDEDGDGYSATLADVAKYYYDEDLSPLDDNVTQTVFDDNKQQHMNTFTVAFGVNGALTDGDNDGWPGIGDAYTESSNWGNPLTSGDSAEKVDDLWHAAFNSKGRFSNARNPAGLVDSLDKAISNISARTGSAATVAFNTSTLTGDSHVYLAQFSFFNEKWSGELSAFEIDEDNGDVSTTSAWSASDLLTSRQWSSRQIITANNGVGVPFEWNSISTAMQDDLRTNPLGLLESVSLGMSRMDFIKGDRQYEGVLFKERDGLLGDIVHSSPIYVGKPDLQWSDAYPFPTGSTYSDYKALKKDRSPVVYVGSNDGFLHGFSADTGEELFAYLPESLASTGANEGLHYLSDMEYSHRFYTDLTPVVSDVYANLRGSNEWHSILVGGLRSGGKGLFALDVSSPDLISESTASDVVLWEFDNTDEPNMGYTHSMPAVSLMNNGRWGVVVGNGYANTGDGKAKLYILFVDGGIDGVWTKGVDYIEIDTTKGSIVNGSCQDASSDCNGLSSVQVVDLDKDLVADRVYAGDLHGNMWAFDVSSSNELEWGVAYNDGLNPAPLFAKAGHSITSKPSVSIRPNRTGNTEDLPDLLVFFGTGSYLYGSDPGVNQLESFYGVWDHGQANLTSSDLVQQSYIVDAGQPNYRLVTDRPVYYGADTQGHGWEIPLSHTVGERVIVDPVVRDNLVFFNTWVPDSDPCNAGGSGYLVTVKTSNGGPPSPAAAFDITGDGIIDEQDVITYQDEDTGEWYSAPPSDERYEYGLPASSGFIDNYQYTPGTRGGSTIHKRSITDVVSHNKERIAWREIINQ